MTSTRPTLQRRVAVAIAVATLAAVAGAAAAADVAAPNKAEKSDAGKQAAPDASAAKRDIGPGTQAGDGAMVRAKAKSTKARKGSRATGGDDDLDDLEVERVRGKPAPR